MIKTKKAQEEVMGFVIIIMLVMIIGLVFLAFSLRKGDVIEQEKVEVNNFLQAMLSYTTDCSINYVDQDIRELVKECYNYPTKTCLDSENICTKLNSTIEKIFDELIGIEEDIAHKKIHGYNFTISSDNGHPIMHIKRGNLTGSYFTSFIPITSGAYKTVEIRDIIVKLKCYYS